MPVLLIALQQSGRIKWESESGFICFQTVGATDKTRFRARQNMAIWSRRKNDKGAAVKSMGFFPFMDARTVCIKITLLIITYILSLIPLFPQTLLIFFGAGFRLVVYSNLRHFSKDVTLYSNQYSQNIISTFIMGYKVFIMPHKN